MRASVCRSVRTSECRCSLPLASVKRLLQATAPGPRSIIGRAALPRREAKQPTPRCHPLLYFRFSLFFCVFSSVGSRLGCRCWYCCWARSLAGRVPTWNILDRSVSVSAGSRPATQVQTSRPTPKAATRTRETGQQTSDVIRSTSEQHNTN